MNRKLSVLVGVFLLASLPAVPATTESPEQFDKRYRLLAESKTGKMQAELDEAAAANYHLVTTWWGGGREEMMVLLEKSEDPALLREYRLISARNETDLDKELQEAAAQGFRVTPDGQLRNTLLADLEGEEIVLILERTLGDSEPREYSLIDIKTAYLYDEENERYLGQFGALQAELAWLPDEGFRLVAHLGRATVVERDEPCEIHHILIAEKLPAASQGSGQDAEGQQKRYRLIAGRQGAEVQQALNEAAAAGYRLRFGSLFDLPNPDHLTLIMEMADDTSGPYKYLMVGSSQCCLGIQHDLAAERGYLAHPRGVFTTPLVTIMERKAGDQSALDYAWVETEDTETFEENLIEHSAAGYEFVAALSRRRPIKSGNGWSMNNTTQIGWLVKETDPYPSAESRRGVRTDVEWKTLGLQPGDKDEELQERLNEAARDGYCLVNMAAFHDGWRFDRELAATMEKRGNSQECEYAVLSAGRTSALQKDIDEAAGKGFRLLRGGMFAKRGFMDVSQRGVVMERTPGITSPAYEYILLTTQRESTMAEEIEAASLDGYELVARPWYAERTVFMERPVRDPGQ